MFCSQLPSELWDAVVTQGIYHVVPALTHDVHPVHALCFLHDLCMVSKNLYAIAAVHLYRDAFGFVSRSAHAEHARREQLLRTLTGNVWLATLVRVYRCRVFQVGSSSHETQCVIPHLKNILSVELTSLSGMESFAKACPLEAQVERVRITEPIPSTNSAIFAWLGRQTNIRDLCLSNRAGVYPSLSRGLPNLESIDVNVHGALAVLPNPSLRRLCGRPNASEFDHVYTPWLVDQCSAAIPLFGEHLNWLQLTIRSQELGAICGLLHRHCRKLQTLCFGFTSDFVSSASNFC